MHTQFGNRSFSLLLARVCRTIFRWHYDIQILAVTVLNVD